MKQKTKKKKNVRPVVAEQMSAVNNSTSNYMQV